MGGPGPKTQTEKNGSTRGAVREGGQCVQGECSGAPVGGWRAKVIKPKLDEREGLKSNLKKTTAVKNKPKSRPN